MSSRRRKFRPRVIPFREAREPLTVTRLDRSGYLVRLEDRYGRPFFLSKGQMERLIWNL